MYTYEPDKISFPFPVCRLIGFISRAGLNSSVLVREYALGSFYPKIGHRSTLRSQSFRQAESVLVSRKNEMSEEVQTAFAGSIEELRLRPGKNEIGFVCNSVRMREGVIPPVR